MIANAKQYGITRRKAADITRAISESGAASRANVHPKLLQAELGGMRSIQADLGEELAEYEALEPR